MTKTLTQFRKDSPIHRPSLFKLALEARTLFEAGSLLFSFPWLQASPKGDGHPVLVLPGFTAFDVSTKLMRMFLNSRNYKTYGWNLGQNLGKHSDPETGCDAAIIKRLTDIYQWHGEKVTVIGWSLGGVYARELARLHPDKVRQVITMGTPFSNNQKASHATKLFEYLSGFKLADMSAELAKNMPLPPPVPSTAFYSKSDGITAWQCCLEQASDMTQNIEVQCSHLGYGHHPVVMWALADRLAQADGEWQPFNPNVIEKLFYK